MGRSEDLTGSERNFFRLVDEAAFVNPFNPERLRLDRELAGDEAGDDPAGNLAAAVRRVRAVVTKLETRGPARLDRYAPADRRFLRTAFLFDTFHRFAEAFDDLIREQVAAGDTLCRVPFAGTALSILASRGFSSEESERYFSFFFQMRRAYFFIHHGLIGESPSMVALRRRLWNNVFTGQVRWYEEHLWNRMEDFSTLLLGETGTGKGAAAAAIGRSGFIPFDPKRGRFSESFTRNFITINLTQFPETLIESELFGHRKGAFTGAMDHHEGLLARCTPHGAVFIDEIGDAAVPVQIKLLQVLQDRVFAPVGSRDRKRFSGRVIAATNRPLRELRREGRFRDDFYYRLCSDVITVPPLRVRLREDPAERDRLIGQLLRRIVGNDPKELITSVANTLKRSLPPDYGWPGNVRELEQAVRRVLLTRGYEGDETPSGAPDLATDLAEGRLSAQELLSRYCRSIYDRFGTYEEVARRAGLDRRTAKKYVTGSG